MYGNFNNDKAGNAYIYEQLPMGGLKVYLMLHHIIAPDEQVGDATTNPDGSYSLSCNIHRYYNDYDFYVVVAAQNSQHNIYGNYLEVAPGSTIFNWVVNNKTPGQKRTSYFNVTHSGSHQDITDKDLYVEDEMIKGVYLAANAYDFLNAKSGRTFSEPLEISLSDVSIPTFCWLNPLSGLNTGGAGHKAIMLTDGDVRSENVVYHEFGHFAMWLLQNKDWNSIFGGTLADHSFEVECNSFIAWNEGWADGFFAMVDGYNFYKDHERAFDEERFRGKPNDLEQRKTPLGGVGYHDINNGLLSEFNIACAIFDLWDGPNNYGPINMTLGDAPSYYETYAAGGADNCELSFETICDVIANKRADGTPLRNVEDFYFALMKEADCSTHNDIATVFNGNDVVFDIQNKSIGRTSFAKDAISFVTNFTEYVSFLNVSNTLDVFLVGSRILDNTTSFGSFNIAGQTTSGIKLTSISDDLTIQGGAHLAFNENEPVGLVSLGSNDRPLIASTQHSDICNAVVNVIDDGFIDVGDPSAFSYATVNLYNGSYIHIGNELNPSTNGALNINYGSSLHVGSGCILELHENSALNISGAAGLVIENGGIFIVHKNVAFSINGTIQIKDGGQMKLLDDAEFLIGAANFGSLSIFGSTSTALIPGTNARITLDGGSTYSSTWPPMSLPPKLTIGGSLGLVPDKTSGGDVTFDLRDITIYMDNTNNNSPMFCAFNGININHCEMNTTGNSSTWHSGLHLYGQNGITISYFQVENAITGINDAAHYLGNSLSLDHFNAFNCDQGVVIDGTSLFMNNSSMTVYTSGLKAENMTGFSEIDRTIIAGTTGTNGSITPFSDYGIFYSSGLSGAYLKMGFCTIEYGRNGVNMITAPLVSKCNNFNYVNNVGIELNYSSLYSGINANFSHVGITDFTAVQNDINLTNAQGLFIDNGGNKFESIGMQIFGNIDAGFYGPIALGSSSFSLPSIDATYNKWDIVDKFGTYNNLTKSNYVYIGTPYSVYSQVNLNITPEDPSVRTCTTTGYNDPWGPQYMIRQEQPEIGGKNPIFSSGCFASLTLDSALVLSLHKLDDSITDIRGQINLLSQLLQYPFASTDLNGHDTIVLSLGYQAMMQAFSNGLTKKLIKTGKDSLDSASIKVLNTQKNLLSRLPSDTNSYHLKLLFSIDQAATLCAIYPDSMTSGIDSFNTIATWAHPSDMNYVNYLKCVNSKYWDIKRGFYTIKQADSIYNCSYTPPIKDMIANIDAGRDTSICANTNVQIGTFPINGHSYNWRSIPSGFTSNISNPIVRPNITTIFILEETVTSTNFSKIDSITITVNPLPTPDVGGNASLCIGSAIGIGSSPKGGHSYSWQSTPNGFTSTNSNPTVSPVITTIYSLKEIIDATGCSDSSDVIITVNPLPDANAGSDVGICGGSSAFIGNASVVSGNTYIWTSSPAGFSSSYNNPLVSPLITTQYTLTEKNVSTGCQNSNNVTVTVNENPLAITGPDRIICSGDQINIGTTPIAGHSYSWALTPSSYISSITESNPSVSPTSTTNYVLNETIDATGCSKMNYLTVTVNPLPIPYAGVDATITPPTMVSLGTSAISGHVYSWSSDPIGFTSNLSNPVVSPTVLTIYHLTETILATGCVGKADVTISIALGKKGVTGVEEQSVDGKFKIIPNPFINQLILELPEQNKTYHIEVYDLLGKLMYANKGVSGSQLMIDTHTLIPATYLLLIKDTEGNTARYKIIKIKE